MRFLRRGNARAFSALLAVALAAAAFSPATTGCSGGPGTSSDPNLSASQKGTVYYIDDHLGSAQLLTDSEGQVVYEGLVAPYGLDLDGLGTGATEGQGDSNGPDYSYTTKERDEETGLIYFGKRYYSPKMGRWITPDPLFMEDPVSVSKSPHEGNLYSYVRNNPTRNVDPDGAFAWDVTIDIAFFAYGLQEYVRNPNLGNGINLVLDTAGLLPVIPALGAIKRGIFAANKIDNISSIGGRVRQSSYNSIKRKSLQSAKKLSGYGDLTIDEAGRIRQVAIEARHDLYVVGSAARGQRGVKRAVSDIDYLVESTDDLMYRRYDGDMTIEELIRNKAPGPHEHGIHKTNFNPNRGPGILFSPDGSIRQVGK